MEPTTPTAEYHDDVVDRAVAEVRRDLQDRRARGELPRLPDDEFRSQFAGVVESVDARLVEEHPVDVGGLGHAATLPVWTPSRTDPLAKVVGILLRPLMYVTGTFVRLQVARFSQRTAVAVRQLVERQEAMSKFLAGAHLDRIRTLEYRVAELEQQLDQMRSGRP
jgi:hypothetical protein